MNRTVINIRTGTRKVRQLLSTNKNSITLEVPEFRTGAAKYYWRPTLGRYFNEYLGEAVYNDDPHKVR